MVPSQKGYIPWSEPHLWEQMKLSLQTAAEVQGENLYSLKALAERIREKFFLIEDHLESLCLTSCQYCKDICCSRATLWYDLRDLLFIYMVTGGVPEKQLSRKQNGNCSCLTSSGCCLARWQRPFICTWYICPQQKGSSYSQLSEDEKEHMTSTLQSIKSDRLLLEDLFVRAVCL